MTIPVPKPRLTGYSTTPKLDLMKISGAYIKNCPLFGFIASKIGVKACLIRGFVLPKIGFYEDFRLLRQKLLDVTQHMVMSLPGNFRHLQAGDGGDREGPAKKAPCGWLGHTHRAEDEAEERKPVENGLGAVKAAWPQGGPHRGRVSMI